MKGGLIVEVFRGDHDCTNEGASSRHNRFTLIGEGVEGPFEPTAERPALLLVRRSIGGREYLHARPASIPEGKWSMFGGNFVHTSDSRFPNDYPIPVHDRVE